MAVANLQVSSEFFKAMSLEYQHLSHSVQLLSTFSNRAWVRAVESGDKRLLLILEQLELFISTSKHHMGNLEKLMRSTVIVD